MLSVLRSMRIAPEALVLFFGAVLLAAAAPAQESPEARTSPSPSPSPSPAPRAKLLPYWYETEAQRNAGPLLHFEDRAEVRALEMNAAIARFFDSTDENGDMRRGATPGGAPSLDEMREYRPHVSPSANFLGLAAWALQGLKGGFSGVRKPRTERNEELLRALLLASATPTPSPQPSPSPSPTR